MPPSASARRSSSPKAVTACANLILILTVAHCPPPTAGSGQHLQRKRPRRQGWFGCQQKRDRPSAHTPGRSLGTHLAVTREAPVQDSRNTDPYRATGAKPQWPRPENAGRSCRDQEDAELAELIHDFPRWQIVQVFGGWLAVERPAAYIQSVTVEAMRVLLTDPESTRREPARRDVQP